MPLLRQSLYSQNVTIYCAPTADARDTWLPLMRTAAFEGRTFVLSANQCVRYGELPGWITSSASSHAPAVGGGASASTPALQRKHSITHEGPHEIVWPEKGENGQVPDVKPEGKSLGKQGMSIYHPESFQSALR